MTLTAQEIADGYLAGSPMSQKQSLDVLVRYCQNHRLFKPEHAISGISTEGPLVQIGPLVFRANCHDTGCDVCAWILSEDGDVYQFIGTTFWYSSQYTFNKSRWQKGAWDAAVSAAIDQMREAMEANEAALAKSKADRESEKLDAAAQRKAKFERLFMSSQS